MFLYLVMAASYLHVYLFDPGMIPPSNPDEDREIIKTQVLELARTGHLDRRHFCLTCKAKKPLRSKHCRSCNRCVALFDHHCPWTNSCIAMRNRHTFVVYLVSGLLCFIIFLFLSFSCRNGLSLEIELSIRRCFPIL